MMRCSQFIHNNSADLHEYHQILEREHENPNIHDVAVFTKLFIPKPSTESQSGITSLEDVSDINNTSSILMVSPDTESDDRSCLTEEYTRFSALMEEAIKPQEAYSPLTITTRWDDGKTPFRNNLTPIPEGDVSASQAITSENRNSQLDEIEVSRSLFAVTPQKTAS